MGTQYNGHLSQKEMFQYFLFALLFKMHIVHISFSLIQPNDMMRWQHIKHLNVRMRWVRDIGRFSHIYVERCRISQITQPRFMWKHLRCCTIRFNLKRFRQVNLAVSLQSTAATRGIILISLILQIITLKISDVV